MTTNETQTPAPCERFDLYLHGIVCPEPAVASVKGQNLCEKHAAEARARRPKIRYRAR